jgi:hypothetical protein
MVRSEISVNWSKFSQRDVSALKSKDDLISQFALTYEIEKQQAKREIDAFMNGRDFDMIDGFKSSELRFLIPS